MVGRRVALDADDVVLAAQYSAEFKHMVSFVEVVETWPMSGSRTRIAPFYRGDLSS